MSLLGEESAGEFYLLGLLCYGLLTQEVSSWKCCACEVRWIVFAAPLGIQFSLVGFAQASLPKSCLPLHAFWPFVVDSKDLLDQKNQDSGRIKPHD